MTSTIARDADRMAALDNPSTAAASSQPLRKPSDRQVEAVYAVMRLLRDDSSPSPVPETIVCDCCKRDRPARGSVSYGSRLLCNGCATDYELLRIARSIRGIDDFLNRR